MDYSTLHSHFPLPQIRPQQDYVLREIANAINSGYRAILLEAPTGSGKSAIAMTLCKALGTSYIVTGTKDLMSQYRNDHPELWQIIGRKNFSCYELEETMEGDLIAGNVETPMCDAGPCMSGDYHCKFKPHSEQYELMLGGGIKYNQLYEHRSKEGKMTRETITKPCKYFDQKYKGLKARHTIMNYDYFFTMCKYSNEEIGTRELLVLDEGHQLESKMVEFSTLLFSRSIIDKIIPFFQFPKCDESQKYDIQFWKSHFTKLRSSMDKVITFLTEADKDKRGKMVPLLQKDEMIRGIIDSGRIRLDMEYAEEFNALYSKVVELISSLQSHPQNWVITEVLEKNGMITFIKFVPLDISKYFQPIYEKGGTILCMSATILDRDSFCKVVGLPLDEVKFIRIDSDFPVENRIIYPLNVNKLNSNTLKDEKVQESIALTIDMIMNKHSKEKGIIHTTSYKQSTFIKSHLSKENKQRILETSAEADRVKVLSDHKQRMDGSVLMSPSFHTGLDLKDDLSRFQILVKVPYPDMGDRWIKAKMSKSQQWYNWQTGLKLVQAYGRSIRSKTDFATTYILDSNFGYFVMSNRSILPKWFTEAIKYALPTEVGKCRVV